MQAEPVSIVNANSDPMIPSIIRINKIVWETEDTFTIHLKPNAEFAGEFHFKPGQFNMIYVFGVGESALSISSSPHKPKTLTHTIRRIGTITTALSKLNAGTYVGLRGPFGTCWPVENAIGKDVCIVAGGIGLAPLRPVIYSVLKNRRDYGKMFVLYGARSPLDLLYRVELEQWNKQFNVEVHVTVDHGDSSWKGNIGVASNLFNYISLDKNNTVAMICGPETMMKFTVMELLELGMPAEKIFLSLERNMKCAIGFCGHCQFGPKFICKDGPVFNYQQIGFLFEKKEI